MADPKDPFSMEKRDYYEVLEVSREADGTTIKKSYRRLAVQYHPDKNPDDPSAEDKFKEIGEAYEILMDPQKRAAYDRYGHRAFSQGTGPSAGAGGFGGADPFDIFREVFGGRGGGGGGSIFDDIFGGGSTARSERRKRGSDLRYDLPITLEEAASGVEKELKIDRLVECGACGASGAQGGKSDVRSCPTCNGIGQVVISRGFFQVQQACPDCAGTGESISNPCRECKGEGRIDGNSRIKIKIPPGIMDGGKLRSLGHGDAGRQGGVSGDLYVVVHVKEHEVFERDDNDLHCEVPLSFTRAALGGELEVPTLGGKAAVKIPAGTQTDTVFRLREKGIPDLQTGRNGDLHVHVLVEVPVKLSKDQEKLLRDFEDSITDKNHPVGEGFFEKAKRFFKG